MSARCEANVDGEETGYGDCRETLSGQCQNDTKICCRACNIPLCSLHIYEIKCNNPTCVGYNKRYAVCQYCENDYIYPMIKVGDNCYCCILPEYVTLNVPITLGTI
jgi:hypothetical protein